MYDKTIAEQSKALNEGSISSVELTQIYLDRIHKLNSQYNSYITVTDEIALNQAMKADKNRAAGNSQILTGIPLSHKDNFCTKGVRSSCGSRILDNFIAPYESAVTANFHQAGAVMLGKTNMDEFGMGSTNENSYYGITKNPWDNDAIPGGSSGGSAACISAKLAAGSTGTDTGGSIRQPASHCGITGIKPTYGRVSRHGMIAYASSLDQAGPMTQNAEDAAIMLSTMAGFDHHDSTSIDKKVPNYTAALNNSIEGLTIGLPKEYFTTGLSSDVEENIRNAITEYEKLGAKVIDISLPNSKLSISAYYVIATAEASSNLSRFDGVRFGYRCQNPESLDDLYIRSRSEGFGKEVKRRILVGTYALSAGYYDAYYIKAQKIRRLIRDDLLNAFLKCDVIMGPNAPTSAFNIGEKCNDPIALYLSDVYTTSVNLAGLPAMSIPIGLSKNNRPVGLQIIGQDFSEELLLNVAHRFQQATDWHLQTPSTLS